MAYTYLTYGGAKAQLASRLHDTSSIFYTDTGTYPELEVYLKEALRVWQVLTAYWREEPWPEQFVFGGIAMDVGAIAEGPPIVHP